MTTQIGTKEIVVNGQVVTVRVFAPKSPGRESQPRYQPNEDTLHALRMDSVYGENR